MPKCTAPRQGHRTAATEAECPKCGPEMRAARVQPPTYAHTSRAPRVTNSAGGSGTTAAPAVIRRARQTGGAAGADFIVWIVLAQIVRDHLWLMLLGMLFIGVPVALAAQWTYQCSAWVNDGTARCRRPRAGFLRRCHDHGHAIVTWYDLAAAAAAAIAVINLLILIKCLDPSIYS